MSWLSSLFGGTSNSATEFSDLENKAEEIAGLNFKTALEAHIKWKHRLKDAIDGTGSEVLNPQVVCKDDQCELGQWLYGGGQQKFGNLTVFKDVVMAHSHFHKCAGQTLELALDGKNPEAEKELVGGSFAKASMDVSHHLMRLWRDVGIDH